MENVKAHEELIKKWTQVFKFYDVDGNGVLSQSDFDIIHKSIINKAKLTTQKKTEILKLSEDMWVDFLGKNPDKKMMFLGKFFRKMSNEKMTLEELLVRFDDLLQKGALAKLNRDYRTRMFQVMDLNEDNRIDLQEFVTFADCLGQSSNTNLDKAFHTIDANSDGYISLDEWVNAYEAYLTDPCVTIEECALFGLPKEDSEGAGN